MPRKHEMPGGERAICYRLREFRTWTGVSQAAFCSLAGLNLRAYASYEYRRSQLNYVAARQILSVFHVLNPIWLATGEGKMLEGRVFQYPEPEHVGAGKRTAFSKVFETSLKMPLLAAPKSHLVKPVDGLRLFTVEPTVEGRLFCKERLGDLVSNWLAERTDSDVENFMNQLLMKSAQVASRFPRDADKSAIRRRLDGVREIESRRRFGHAGKDMLTDTASAAKPKAVKSQPMSLKNLLANANRLTSEPGKKTELANFLNAPLESVSRWLSGKREPGGETTLRLLRWVEHQERTP
jgi:DNA-binding transcriptional regulator YiaG